jgi:hypothetical protein
MKPRLLIVELLLHAREALSAIAPHQLPTTGFPRSLERLTVVFARRVDTQETALLPRCGKPLDASTFRKITENASIAWFHLAARARLQALRAVPKAP